MSKRKAPSEDAPAAATPAPKKAHQDETTLESISSLCRDNITGAMFVDPVIAEDGHTYERRAIAEWFRRTNPPRSPVTNEEMGKELRQNYTIKSIVEGLATSPGVPRLERAEWHVARGKLHCERDATPGQRKVPDVGAARAAFARAEELLDDSGSDVAARKLGEEATVCRELCDRVLDISRLREKADANAVDVAWADDVFDSLFRHAGVRLSLFQRLAKGTRVRVVDDRRAVLAAFEAQDDVLGLPDDWEESLGLDFVVEAYDSGDSTYVLLKPSLFDPIENNEKHGKWWPYSVVSILP